MEVNLVEIWLRRDPVRWIAGALAGLFAGLIALAFAMVLSSAAGGDFWFPAKILGTILVGPFATEYGLNWSSILSGVLVLEAMGLFWGVVYAHMTGTNSLQALLPIGLVWGIFSWIFIWNLFLQSFQPLHAAGVASSVALFVCLVYGLSLTSVSFFDRALRGSV